MGASKHERVRTGFEKRCYVPHQEVRGRRSFEIARFDAKLSNQQFVTRAPEDVLNEQREKRADAVALAARLAGAIARLQ